MREGERVSCEVRGNPQPSVTWYRNGKVVVLPARARREDAGKYTALARRLLEQKNFTVEVEVLGGHGRSKPHFTFEVEDIFESSFPPPPLFPGSTNSCDRYFLLLVVLVQIINGM